eukprot:CAMPEP_0184486874 /NCGR_PEP_ID=MMETSP0113_2-20130426/8764_1 /TAXON_ID=91329 /ORGANISM="Norrisiella sphaerica, Strain BC52" /LENGTH=32 /DNA_ID= /DNA_START= /DNA_END= /DNA_ORIENTATION=
MLVHKNGGNETFDNLMHRSAASKDPFDDESPL